MSVDVSATLAKLFDLSGKTAVVTGATVGIGRGIALALGQLGVKVVVAARNAVAAESVVAEIAQAGGSALALPLQVDSEESVVALFKQARAALGRIDILVNNAGIFPPNTLLETTGDQWDEVQHSNTRGTFFCIREAGKIMRDDGHGGRIINISSIGGVRSAIGGRTAYNASKAAVNRLTEEAAIELAPHGILVNAVLPGPTATEKLDELDAQGSPLRAAIARKVPLARWGTPDDIAAAVIYLASPAAAFVTGQTLAVDGGAGMVI
ncbi:MAG: SDR family NAD(P)-dependent oxidoreductase [Spongiibacteraceae bacterium]